MEKNRADFQNKTDRETNGIILTFLQISFNVWPPRSTSASHLLQYAVLTGVLEENPA